MSGDLSELLKNAQKSAGDLLNLLEEAQRSNHHLSEQLTVYKRKCRALETVLKALKKERAKDRETIKKWQEQLYQSAPSYHDLEDNGNPRVTTQLASVQAHEDLATSGGSHDMSSIPPGFHDHETSQNSLDHKSKIATSDGVNDCYEHHALLSQRVLPMSIGVSDLHDASLHRSEESIISSSPPQLSTSGDNNSQLETSAKKRTLSAECSQRREWLLGLVNMKWHPSDFKYDDEEIYKGAVPFHCVRGRCEECRESMKILNQLGTSNARSQADDGLEVQDTPAGFWRVDYLNSSQVRADHRQNEETQQFEGLQRLAMTLWRNHYVFREKNLREEFSVHMK